MRPGSEIGGCDVRATASKHSCLQPWSGSTPSCASVPSGAMRRFSVGVCWPVPNPRKSEHARMRAKTGPSALRSRVSSSVETARLLPPDATRQETGHVSSVDAGGGAVDAGGSAFFVAPVVPVVVAPRVSTSEDVLVPVLTWHPEATATMNPRMVAARDMSQM